MRRTSRGASGRRARSAGCSSPTTCSRSRSRRSCCSSRRSEVSSSAPTRAGRRRMLGPSVAWYLGVAAFLFGTGALGVLLRRNPLIVLLSLEIMLNGSNLALIAFSRHHGNGDGQIFALAVMAVAASEVVVGLGLIVALNRKRLALDVDKLSTLRG